MEEQRTPTTEAELAKSDADQQNASARAGAGAKGGVAARPGDPTSPAEADERAKQRNRALKEGGFGDDKGARI